MQLPATDVQPRFLASPSPGRSGLVPATPVSRPVLAGGEDDAASYYRDSVVTRWNTYGVLGRPHPKIGQSAWTRRSRSLHRPQVPEDACTWWFHPRPWIDRLCLCNRNHHRSEREAQCDSPKPEVPADHRAFFPHDPFNLTIALGGNGCVIPRKPTRTNRSQEPARHTGTSSLPFPRRPKRAARRLVPHGRLGPLTHGR
jgi:hypothetical protein